MTFLRVQISRLLEKIDADLLASKVVNTDVVDILAGSSKGRYVISKGVMLGGSLVLVGVSSSNNGSRPWISPTMCVEQRKEVDKKAKSKVNKGKYSFVYLLSSVFVFSFSLNLTLSCSRHCDFLCTGPVASLVCFKDFTDPVAARSVVLEDIIKEHLSRQGVKYEDVTGRFIDNLAAVHRNKLVGVFTGPVTVSLLGDARDTPFVREQVVKYGVEDTPSVVVIEGRFRPFESPVGGNCALSRSDATIFTLPMNTKSEKAKSNRFKELRAQLNKINFYTSGNM